MKLRYKNILVLIALSLGGMSAWGHVPASCDFAH